MTETLKYDLSRDMLKTTYHGLQLARSRVEQTIDEVYDDFSGDAPIQMHLLEFSAQHRLRQSDSALPMPDLSQLKRFDYLSAPSLDIEALRTKGAIALSMIVPEMLEGELSAELVEPFQETVILPILYQRWKAKRNRIARPPLYL